MANATPVRLGQANQSGSNTALFAQIYTGEVQKTFRENNVALARTRVRQIASGK